MKDETSAKLLPCPFCGPVEIVHQWAGNVNIKHKDACFMHAMMTLYGEDQIAAWNRRVNSVQGRSAKPSAQGEGEG